MKIYRSAAAASKVHRTFVSNYQVCCEETDVIAILVQQIHCFWPNSDFHPDQLNDHIILRHTAYANLKS